MFKGEFTWKLIIILFLFEWNRLFWCCFCNICLFQHFDLNIPCAFIVCFNILSFLPLEKYSPKKRLI